MVDTTYGIEANINGAVTENKKTWLLTWNPKYWEWEEYAKNVDDTRNGKEIEVVWSCNNSHVAVGDRVFLIVVGKGDKNGIIAAGYATSPVFEMDHWDPEKESQGKKSQGITVCFDHILDYTNQDILKQSVLKEKLPNQVWSPMGSGIEIKQQYVSQLEEEWDRVVSQYKLVNDEQSALTSAYMAGIQEAIFLYKKDINKYWNEEKYKWIAVKTFQDNWNIDADDFSEMLTWAFSNASNLLSGGNYYPYKMLSAFAKHFPNNMRELFRFLYDDTIELKSRIKRFRIECSELLKQLREQIPGYEKANNHYQDLRAICVYLSFKYPDSYFLYKYQMYTDFKKAIGYLETSEETDYDARQYDNFKRLCLEIVSATKKDTELCQEQRELVESEPRAYVDTNYHLLVQTIIYVYKRAKEKENDTIVVYWPSKEEYSVEITKEEWKRYIEEIEYRNYPSSMAMLKALMEQEGEASCKKLSDVYGGHPSRYVSIAANLGKRAKKYFDLPPCMDGDVERFFPIPFLGREVSIDGTLYYSYKIREALFQALEEIDLTDVNPYFEDEKEKAPVESEPEEIKKYTKNDFLNEVFMTEENYDSLVSLLNNKKNLILQGAPGVGKTFAAKRLAYSIMGMTDDRRIQFVQFHQNYSYEDFVMGFRPNETGFELKYGTFYQFCKLAEAHPNEKYYFIIDEINRGNLSKVFGELLMLIEKDHRGERISLAYNGISFAVPKNMYIIGMMNTADRSLAMIDYALRRRFSFYNMEPGFETEGFIKYQKGLKSSLLDKLIEAVIELNGEIKNDKSLGDGFCIGHSYFCGHTEEDDIRWLSEVVDYDILPTLSEYWFDDSDKVDKWSKTLKGVINGQ